ncbi:MAG TPA: Hsp20/alpha crystallin family protein [Longimicrobiales bacterium]|nr:Hsp20/alpha crystallin family protein [Longimicrobiales bacterium]
MPALIRRGWGTDVTPWSELETISDRMRRWMDIPSLFGTPLLTATRWMPAVELSETDDEYVLTAEIPGMSKEDVSISVEDDVLTLAGEKKLEKEEEDGRVYLREREYGAFERCFTLPRNVDAEKITAEYRDGLVHIRMPKAEVTRGRHIEIK